jgi:aminopeptidase N
MLRWKLGDSVFFQSVRNYLNDPQLNFSYALTPDLQKHFEKTSGKDLSGFFNNWVYSQGFPSYNLQWATVGNRTIQTILSQTTSDTSVLFFEMPVPILFKNGTRDTTIIIDHIKNGQANLFNIGFIPDTAYIDPDLMIIAANNTVGKVEVFPTKDNIVVFPNPVGNAFNVLLRNMTEGVLHLSLHNSAGQVVWRKRYGGFNGQDQIVVPSMTLSSGYYFLSIHKDDDPVIIKRILR